MAEAKKKTVSADDGNPMQTLVNLWPYLWPADRFDLKMRVVWATVFLIISKFVLILVPYFFKWATDALDGRIDMAGLLPTFLLGAVALVIFYNLTRILQVGLNQLRDALFQTFGTEQRLSDDYVRTVLEARDGAIWIGTSRGLDRWQAEAVTRSQALSGDAILSKTLDGIITSWNAGAERLFGFTAADVNTASESPTFLAFQPVTLQKNDPFGT